MLGIFVTGPGGLVLGALVGGALKIARPEWPTQRLLWILNAANVNFIAFNHYVAAPGTLTGQVFSIFVIVLAAAEAAIGLAIVLAIYQTFKTIDVQETNLLKE